MPARNPRGVLLAAALVGAVAAACTGVSIQSDGTPVPTPSITAPVTATPAATAAPASMATATGPIDAAGTQGVPKFAHVYILVLENKAYSSIVGSSSAPYLNGLIAKNGLATNYDAVAHPSQPNYIALFSGSTQGVSDDGAHDVSAQNLADQLEAHGKTWAFFAQDYPGGCFTGGSKSGTGEGGGVPGDYVRKHVPAISFTGIASNPARCGNIKSLAQFDPAAADFEFLVPNLCNDMHSCGVDVGDSFLAAFLPKLINSPAFANSVLFITTDEGTSDAGGGGQVATIVVSPLTHPGFKSAVPYTHYSILRTIEDAWGLGCLANACNATNMAAFFK